MTLREIQGHLQEMYGPEVSPTLIYSVSDTVMDDTKDWQAHPLDALQPIVYLDCIHVKTRDAGAVRAEAVYLTLGISMTGVKNWWACELLRLRMPSSGCRCWPNSRSGS